MFLLMELQQSALLGTFWWELNYLVHAYGLLICDSTVHKLKCFVNIVDKLFEVDYLPCVEISNVFLVTFFLFQNNQFINNLQLCSFYTWCVVYWKYYQEIVDLLWKEQVESVWTESEIPLVISFCFLFLWWMLNYFLALDAIVNIFIFVLYVNSAVVVCIIITCQIRSLISLFMVPLQICDRFINRRFAQKFYDRVLAVGLQGYAQLYVCITYSV